MSLKSFLKKILGAVKKVSTPKSIRNREKTIKKSLQKLKFNVPPVK